MPSTRSSKDAALKQAALEAKPDQASNIDVKILEKILTKRQHLIWSGGLLLAPLAFIIGLAGLAILLDAQEQTAWYSSTKFAELWRGWAAKMPLLTSALFNGGMLFFIFGLKKLSEHKQALKVLQEIQKTRKTE